MLANTVLYYWGFCCPDQQYQQKLEKAKANEYDLYHVECFELSPQPNAQCHQGHSRDAEQDVKELDHEEQSRAACLHYFSCHF